MKMYRSLTELIGHTPLLELSGYCRANGLDAVIAAKLEAFNPAGSVKDRTACATRPVFLLPVPQPFCRRRLLYISSGRRYHIPPHDAFHTF